MKIESSETPARPQSAEQLAQLFHETYERLAPEFGYRTREASAKPWADVPARNKGLMIAVCADIVKYVIEPELARLRADLELERRAHEQIADYLLPLVGTGDGTSVDAAKKAASELSRLRAADDERKKVEAERDGLQAEVVDLRASNDRLDQEYVDNILRKQLEQAEAERDGLRDALEATRIAFMVKGKLNHEDECTFNRIELALADSGGRKKV